MGLYGLIGVLIAIAMVLTGWAFEAILLELVATIAISMKET